MSSTRAALSNAFDQKRWILAVFSFVSACAICFGFVLNTYHEAAFCFVPALLSSIVLSFVIYAVLHFAFNRIDARKTTAPEKLRKPIPRFAPAISGIVIFTCWIPVLLAAYPGFFSYDAGLIYLGQWSQIEEGILNSHHPVLHTMFLKWSIETGSMLFESFNAGVCFSAILQAVFLAACLSFSLSRMRLWGIGRTGYVLATVYFAISPIVAMFAFCTTKDVSSSACLVVFALSLASVSQSNEKTNAKDLALCSISAFLCCSLRSNLIVVVAASAIVVAIAADRSRVKLACVASVLLGLTFAFVWLVPMSAALGVEKSPIGSWNALGVPMQQLARCAVSPDVSKKDQHVLETQLGDVEYRDDLSDIARKAFMEHAPLGNGGSSGSGLSSFASYYAKPYIKFGIKYPGIYLDAFLAHTQAAWSPFAIINCYAGDESGKTDVFACDVQKPAVTDSRVPILFDFLKWFSSSTEAMKTPLGLFASIPFFLAMMALALVRCIVLGRKTGVVFVLPLLLASFTVLFGPCMLIRYFLYLFLAFPIAMFLIVGRSRFCGGKAL